MYPLIRIRLLDEHLNLDSLLTQLCPHITPKWYEFGVAVGVTKEVLDKCLGYPPEECIVEVLDNWLRTRTTKPTWKDVAEGLCMIEFQQLAENVLKMYETRPGQYIICGDMHAVYL